jgi:multiple sugar transport system substrate-binding protein
MSERKEEREGITRRKYLKYGAAAVVVAAAAAGGVYYATMPPPTPTPAPATVTVTQPAQVATSAATVTVPGGIPKGWTPNPAISGRTINFVCSAEAFLTGIAGSLHEYRDLSKNNVNIETLGYSLMHEKYMLELTSSSSAYDIIGIDSAWVAEMSPYLTPLDDWIKRDNDVVQWDDMAPGARSMVSYPSPEGPTKSYGTSLGLYDTYTWYRTDILNGIGEKYPETVDKVFPIFDKLGMKPGHKPVHNDITGKDDLYGIVIYAGLPFAATCGFMYFWNASGGNFFRPEALPDRKLAINDEIAVQALTRWKQLFDYGPPGQETFDWGAAAAFFDSGKAVFANAILAEHYLAQIDPKTPTFGKVANDVIFQNPDGPYVKSGIKRGTTGVGWVAGIPNNISNDRKEAAWDFIKWITDPGRDLERENADSPRASVLSAISKNPKYSSFLAHAAENRQYGTIGPPDANTPKPELGEGTTRLRMPYAPQFYDIMDAQIQPCLLGKIDPKTALDNCYTQMIKIKPEMA